MRAAFLGTPAAAIPSLASLLQTATVDVVVTRPDRPRGRGRRVGEPPVKAAAREWGLDVAQPASTDELRAALAGRELDVAVVVAYGRILAPDVLEMTRVGFVNVHFSLLPRWRGAAPVEWAILAGDDVTGVSLMLIDEGVDTGPVIAAHETAITDDETGGSLTGRLADLGAVLLGEVLHDFVNGNRMPAPQIEAGATRAPLLSTEDAHLDIEGEAFAEARKVRAFHPRPGAWISVDGTRLKIFAANPGDLGVDAGTMEVVEGLPVVGLASGTLTLLRLQPAGRGAMGGAEWAHGRRNEPGVVDPASE